MTDMIPEHSAAILIRLHTVHGIKHHMETEHCRARHPKGCRWTKTQQGCKRDNCNYLHVTLASADDENISSYHCISCNNEWKDRSCVVKHTIKNTEVFFCLNCDDWVQCKNNVFDEGWSLLDTNGCLRRDV